MNTDFVSREHFNQLCARVAALENAANGPIAPQPATDGLIPRGKYRGRKHADIVKADPQHVCWVAVEGYAAGLGYTEEHIKTAKAADAKSRQNDDHYEADRNG